MILVHWLMLTWEAISRIWDFLHTREAPYNSKEFVEAHSKETRAAIDVLVTLPRLNRGQVEAAMGGVLRSMAAVVQGYHRKGTVNASYMVALKPTEELLGRARFTDEGRKAMSFAGFLELRAWAKPHDGLPKPNEFVLPVEDMGGTHAERLLFGAPNATMKKQPYIVNDTLWCRKHTKNQEPKYRRDVEDYFKSRREHLRSFVSLPVYYPGAKEETVIGCVSIQSDRKFLLGLFPGNQKKLLTALAPLLHILSYVHASSEDSAEEQVAGQGTN